MSLYQIRDWDKHFENDRSRNRQKCSFVCVPNKQHGMGFSRIMAETDGAAIYGIWHCIVGACSQQANRNGWLTDDGEQAVSGWCADDLALKFRRPVKEIQRALDFLCDDKVKWIINHTHHEVTAESPPSHLEGKEGIERREGKARAASAAIAEVFNTWNATASKVGLPECMVVSDKRRRSLEIRLKDAFFQFNWQAALKLISESKFCLGQNDRGWKADFDWFIKSDSVAKIIEGKYSDRPNQALKKSEKPW